MAMSDTGSSFAQWAGLYDDLEHSTEPHAGFADDGNNINVTVAAGATSPTSAGSGGGSPTTTKLSAQQPGIEGPRVGKPARRRSRASRRAPVTLLNTDTANFRAMVQQFTGIPAPPAGAFGAPVINFAGDHGFPPSTGLMSFDHHHHHLHRSQQHPPAAVPLHNQLLRRQQQQRQYTGAAFDYNGLLQGGAGAGGDIFASAEDRMLLQSIQAAAHQMPPASAANNTSPLGFFA